MKSCSTSSPRADSPPSTRTALPGLLLAAAIACLPLASHATENGTTAYPSGGDDFLIAALPPPGWYGFVYFNQYNADSLADNAGHMDLRSFDFSASVVALRLDWVRPVSVLGADRWGTLLFLPYADLDLKLSPAPGVEIEGSKTGLGDLAMGNALHWTFPTSELAAAFDISFPTGAYEQTALVNPGINRWVFRPGIFWTWRPDPAWELSFRLHYEISLKNTATDYQSGQTAYLNWNAGWKPIPPLTLGVAGYFVKQTTDDKVGGMAVAPDGNRLQVDGVGPCVKYFLPNHVMLTAKFFHEFDVRNHPVGNQLWLYVCVPLSSPQH
jgi:hypothetical protein